MRFDVVTVRGTPRAMGRSFGEQCGEKIRACLAQVLGQDAPDSKLRRAEAFVPVYQRYFPDGLEEIQGTAEGAGISFPEALLLQTRWEIATVPDPDACTAFSCCAPVTRRSECYAGMNKDVSEQSRENMVILRMIPGKGPRKLMVAYYGSMAGPGMNEHGVSFFGNSLYGGVARFSVPQPVLMRVLLDCPDMESCVDRAGIIEEDGMVGFSGNFLMSDRSGRAVCIEMMSELYALVYPEPGKGFIAHANHLRTENAAMRAMEKTGYRGNTLGRQARLEALIGEARGSVDARALMRMLADHEGAPHGICRHGAPIMGDEAVTAMSYIAAPKEAGAWVVKGTPCNGEYGFHSV